MENYSYESTQLTPEDYQAFIDSVDELCVYREPGTGDGILCDSVKINIPVEDRPKFNNAHEVQLRRINSNTEPSKPEYLLAFHISGEGLAKDADIAYLGRYFFAGHGRLYETACTFSLSEEGRETKQQFKNSIPALIGAASAGGRILGEFDIQQLQQQIDDTTSAHKRNQHHLHDLYAEIDVSYEVMQSREKEIDAELLQISNDPLLSNLLPGALRYTEHLVECERRLDKEIEKLVSDQSSMNMMKSSEDIVFLRQMVLRAADYPRIFLV